MLLLKSCPTSTETVGLLGTGAQDVRFDFHTAQELWKRNVEPFIFLIKTILGVITEHEHELLALRLEMKCKN